LPLLLRRAEEKRRRRRAQIGRLRAIFSQDGAIVVTVGALIVFLLWVTR
jgi:hypothetical protein